MLAANAKRLGFGFARVIETCDIAVEPWVRLKCRFGCPLYGKSLCCPPASLNEQEMGNLIAGYRHALLVQGTPPSHLFHESLLALERAVFLAGYPEALAFGAGPCPVCPECPEDGRVPLSGKGQALPGGLRGGCLRDDRKAGLCLSPVSHRLGYVKYVGLVLFNKKGSDANPAGPGSIDA